MRIVIDARLYGLENAGLGRYTMNLVPNLLELDKGNHYYLLLRKKYFNSLNFNNNCTKVLADYRHYSLLEQIKIPALIRSLKPDLVHFLHFNVPIFYSGPFLVTIHDLLMHKFNGLDTTTLTLPFYYLKRVGYKKVFDHALKKSLAIITPSNFVKEDLLSSYLIPENKIKVIYEGVGQAFFNNVAKSDSVLSKYKINPPYFFYVGNAYPHKNLPRLLDALISLNRDRSQKISLLIVTPRDVFTKKLDKFVKQRNISALVRILDYVADIDLIQMYKNSLAFIYPSFSEGFGLQGLEAFAVGTLVIASDIRVFKEIYADKARYFNPYDFSSIVAVMENVINMPSKDRFKIVSDSQKYAKLFSWQKTAEQTFKLYESITRAKS